MKSNIVVVNEETGKIVAIWEYDPTNDQSRDQRVSEAAQKCADELGVSAPTKPIMNRGVSVENFTFGRMHGDYEIGMEEIGFGKWGFVK